MLKSTLIKKYKLNPLKTWSIIDREEDLCLLSGFYAGRIYSLENDFFIDWIPSSWKIRRISQPIEKLSIVEEEQGKPRIQDLFIEAYRDQNTILSPREINSILDNSELFFFPEGFIVRVFIYNNKKFFATKDKLNDLKFLTYDLPLGNFLVSYPELVLTYRKDLYGIFDLDFLPKTNLTEANLWLGFTGEDYRISGGEGILVKNNNETIYLKPNSKLWRESLVLSGKYPDNYLLGFPILLSENQLQEQFLNLCVVANFEASDYLSFWYKLVESVDLPFQRISNTFYLYLRALSPSRFGNFYLNLFGVEAGNDFVQDILSLKEETAKGEIQKLILKIWKELKEDYNYFQIKRIIYSKPGNPWINYLELFTFQDDSFNALDIKKLCQKKGKEGNQ